MENKIIADFPFESKFVDVYGSRMHYVDENNTNDSNQTTFVCIHGNPTSSYLWRNIIPYLKTEGRVIAFDLIGFGKSDKPNIDYCVILYVKNQVSTLFFSLLPPKNLFKRTFINH